MSYSEPIFHIFLCKNKYTRTNALGIFLDFTIIYNHAKNRKKTNECLPRITLYWWIDKQTDRFLFWNPLLMGVHNYRWKRKLITKQVIFITKIFLLENLSCTMVFTTHNTSKTILDVTAISHGTHKTNQWYETILICSNSS